MGIRPPSVRDSEHQSTPSRARPRRAWKEPQMRLDEYYREVVRDGRPGRPTHREAREDFRRSVEHRLSAYRYR